MDANNKWFIAQTAADIKKLGVDAASAVQMAKAMEISLLDLVEAGYSLEKLREAGVHGKELMDAGFEFNVLLRAGFSWMDILPSDE